VSHCINTGEEGSSRPSTTGQVRSGLTTGPHAHDGSDEDQGNVGPCETRSGTHRTLGRGDHHRYPSHLRLTGVPPGGTEISRRLTGQVAFDLDDFDAITQVMGISPSELMAAAHETAKKPRRRIPDREVDLECAWRDSNPQPSDP